MSKGRSWLRTLIDLIEVFFNSSQQSKRGRTWHQHVVPYEEGWAVRREGNQRITSKHRKQSTEPYVRPKVWPENTRQMLLFIGQVGVFEKE